MHGTTPKNMAQRLMESSNETTFSWRSLRDGTCDWLTAFGLWFYFKQIS